MKIDHISNNQNFKAKINANKDVKFWESLQPSSVSPKKWAKVQESLDMIEKSLKEETIIIEQGWQYLSAKSQNTGLEIYRMNTGWCLSEPMPNFVIKLGQKFNDQFVPLVERLTKLK